MRLLLSSQFALFAMFTLISAPEANAQNRNSNAFSQLGQQSSIGGSTSLGGGTQSAFGQGGVGGAQSGGQFGGVQGGNRTQPRVGGQDGFIGSDANQVRNQFQSGRDRRRAMFDFAIESLNEMRESRRRRESQNRTSPVRVRVRPLFAISSPSSGELTVVAQENLDRAMASNAATQVTVDGSNATIEGSVGSEYERKLAAKMLKLTPGIYSVDNRLIIESSLPAAPTR